MSRHWPKESLGNVLRYVERSEPVDAAREYRLLGTRWYGGGLFIKDITLGQSVKAPKLYRVHRGDFVYNRLFAWKGSFAVAEQDADGCYVSNEFPCFEADSDRIDISFLKWWFRRESAWLQALGLSSGATPTSRNRLKEKQFLGMGIPLPPLAEQRRIVARIEELAAQIHEARALRERSAEQAEALLASYLSRKFEFGKSGGWRFGMLGDFVVDDRYGTSEKTTDDDSATPILRMGNIQSGRLVFRDLKYLRIPEAEKGKLLLEKGDIVVNRTNSAELVGKCAVFESDGEFGFASYLIRLRLDQSRAEPRLVAAYINSPLGRAFMVSEKKQMTGQANINSTKLKSLPIALPSLYEQRHIVAELDALQAEVDALKRHQADTAAELDALLPAILDRAFKGEL